ncbi:MAG: PKD domain-containing protein [Thermoplasmata archaeon]|nr:PKD domain-containing protein [Thermoplasmata archaeon]MCI4356847.1 PKD domain-containing protein [Thermoplasmata archaeon]
MSYDATDEYVVLFGGRSAIDSRFALNDTWAYHAGVWRNITSTAGRAPPARFAAEIAYDESDHYVFLTGGRGQYQDENHTNPLLTDSWAFAGGHWRQLGASWPTALLSSCQGTTAAFDSTDQFVIVLSPCSGFSTGGQAAAYHNGNWTDLSVNTTTNATIPTPGFIDPLLVDEPALGGVVLFGGTDPFLHAAYNETVLYTGGQWIDETANLTGTPPGRVFAAGDYDQADPGFLLSGGDVDVPPLAATNSTWILSNRTWIQAPAGPAPPADSASRMVWDKVDNASIWFGGIPNETWSWGVTSPLVGLAILPGINPVDVGVATAFSASYEGGTAPFNFTWQFGDGTASNLATPSHAYSAIGSYSVSLVVRDSFGHTAAASDLLNASGALAVSLSAGPNPVDVGVPVAFSSHLSGGSAPLGYNWTFGDGTAPIASPVQAIHAYGVAGNYTAALVVTDAGGGRFVAGATIDVIPGPSVPVITATPISPDLGQLVNFSAVEVGGTVPYHYSWAFGDGGVGGNLAAISHIFTTNGPFVATVTVVDAEGATITGSLNMTIALNVSALGNWSAGAAPLILGFHSAVSGGVPGYTYAWTFGDGGTAAGPTPTHQFDVPGLFTAELRVQDSSGHSAESGWTVFVAPGGGGPLTVTLSPEPSQIAVGGFSLVTATLSGGLGGYTFRWTDGMATCLLAGPLSVRCAPATVGTYPVALTVVDQAGHSATGSTSLTVGAAGTVTSPPVGGLLSWAQIGVTVGVAGAIAVALIVLVVVRKSGGRNAARPREPDAYAEYRSAVRAAPRVIDSGSPSLESGTPAKKPTRPGAPDPLSDLE